VDGKEQATDQKELHDERQRNGTDRIQSEEEADYLFVREGGAVCRSGLVV